LVDKIHFDAYEIIKTTLEKGRDLSELTFLIRSGKIKTKQHFRMKIWDRKKRKFILSPPRNFIEIVLFDDEDIYADIRRQMKRIKWETEGEEQIII
jgi:hypothetical protein